MLSGGERRLTAVALLFAMLEVRPGPVLRPRRGRRALRRGEYRPFRRRAAEPAHQTQFIVITHNRGPSKPPMRSTGITVGDDSVSRVISLRLEEAQTWPSGIGRVAPDRVASSMPFWRRRAEPPKPEVDEPVDPSLVDPDWEPDPADFGDLDDGTPVEPLPTPTRCSRSSRASRRVGPIDDAGARAGRAAPTPSRPTGARRAPPRDPRPRSSRPRADARGTSCPRCAGSWDGTGEGPSWDDVEETLIAGDVGAALAIDLVERPARRDPGGSEAAIRAELAALLVPREPRLESAVRLSPAVRRSS
jgi:hypothetical protein